MIRRIFEFFALVPLLLIPVGCGSDGIKVVGPEPFAISVTATDVTSSSIRLAITANFTSLETPFWRMDIGTLAHFDLQANTPSFYTDTQVTPGVRYCYMAGGNYFMIGSIYSNEECVTPPP